MLAGFLAFSTAAFSQQDFKKHEISLGFSPYSTDLFNWTEFYFSETGVLENVYGERIGSRNTIPMFSVSYNHFFKRWFSLDTRLSFSGRYRNVYYGIESKTSGYTASYRTEGEFKHLGGTSFSGAFKMETFDASGTPLHSCTLNL